MGSLDQVDSTTASTIYTPDLNFNGPDSFTFRVSDGDQFSNTATVSITVNPVNDQPIAASANVSSVEDTPKNITLRGSDPEGDPLTFDIVTPPQHGTISSLSVTGTTTATGAYTPAANFNGSDSFTFRVNDGLENSVSATGSISVQSANDTPVADPQSVSTPEDTALIITLTGSDVDGDAITFNIASNPSHGSLSAIVSTGPTTANVEYVPTVNYHGSDSFLFTSNDGLTDSAGAAVSITVSPINDRPAADANSVSVDENRSVTITLTGSDVDGDQLQFMIVSGPTHGSLGAVTPTGTATAEVSFTPEANYEGSDSFTFKVGDGALNSPPASLSITVVEGLNAPIADSVAISTDEDTSVTIGLSGSDADGDSLTFLVIGGPQNGNLGIISSTASTTATVLYTPADNFSGSDSFVYRANDGSLDGAGATVNITVAPINDRPVSDSQSVVTSEDASIAITLTGSDVDDDSLLFTIVSGPTHGSLGGITLTGTTTSDVTYTPEANYAGSDSFTFKAGDSTLDSISASVSITVVEGLDPPIADSVIVSTDEDTSLTIGLAGSDADGDPLTFLLITGPEHGSLGAITSTGSTTAAVLYTPADDFQGSDSFVYGANDGSLDSAGATVTITVAPINDRPVSDSRSVVTSEDSIISVTLTGGDVDGDPLIFTIVNGPTRGSLGAVTSTGVATAEVAYAPEANYSGSDSFTFQASDGSLDSAFSSVSIAVVEVLDSPVANGVSTSTDEDTSVIIGLAGSDADGDSLTFVVISGPQHGSLGSMTSTGSTTASVLYIPTGDFHGSDSFLYRANDGSLDSTGATVNITVIPINDRPVSDFRSVVTSEDSSITITLAGSDVDGDQLTWTIVDQPQHGSLGTLTTLSTITASIGYIPDPNYNGGDSLSFKASDDSLTSSTSTISIIVSAINDPPELTLADDTFAKEGDSMSLQLSVFSDIEPADTHTASIDWGDGNSSVGVVSESAGSGNVSGSYTYSDNGVFTVTVTVGDSGGGTTSDTLTISVSNVAPTVQAGSDNVVGSTAVYRMPPATFEDVGSADTHTATINWGDDAITVAFVNEGRKVVSSSHRYQDIGTFAVTITVTDDDGGSGSDSFQITVTSVPVTVAIPSVTEWGLLLLGSMLAILVAWRSRNPSSSSQRRN